MKIRDTRIPIIKVFTIGLLPSPLKKMYYRLKGYSIGRRTTLGLGCVLDIKTKCKIEEDVSIGFFCIISCETLFIGKGSKIRSFTAIIVPYVEIGRDVIISETTIIRAQQPFPDSQIIIGDRVHIFPFAIIDPSRPVRIGSESAIGLSTYIFTHGAFKDKLSGFPTNYGEIKIGKGVWLTNRIFVMPGVTLGDDIVVGPSSVVTRSFQETGFVFGIPARMVKRKKEFITPYTDEQQFNLLKEILHEFQIYVQHFYKVKTNLISDNNLVINYGRNNILLMLIKSFDPLNTIEPNHTYIIFEKLKPEIKEFLNKAHISWFSYKSHQCSSNLGEVATVLRDYFSRFGILFERF